MRSNNIRGEKFNKLTAIRFDSYSKSRNEKWLFLCECGKEKVILKSHAKSGHTKSCGCYNSDIVAVRNTKHNHCKRKNRSKLYSTWNSIKQRCYNPNQLNYERYGNRGIKVCDRWLENFNNFAIDMGEPPSKKYSIERIDNSRNYEPSNCRWATIEEQGQNKRNNIMIDFNNIKQCLSKWCKDLNLNYVSTFKKFKSGKSIESIFNHENH